ncbi:MAG: hypothetical protein GC145_10315 [Caulobacter sp.]|nr:hypothetical protein [Caulobacter sp.]
MLRLPFNLGRNGAALAAGLVAVLSLALIALVWVSIQQRPAPAPRPKPPPAPILQPVQDPALDRAALIAMAASAASAYGAGAPLPDQSGMVGQAFQVSIGFDCAGPDLTASRDPRLKRVKLTARLQDWSKTALVKGLAPAAFDQVEGFWLPRPWIRPETCRTTPLPVLAAASAVDRLTAVPRDKAGKADAAPAPPPSPPPPRQTLGLASFFEPGSSRVPQRGGKPYETVQKLTPELEAADSSDLSMVVIGRIGQATEGRPVVCWSETPERRPVCLIAVEIDRVEFRLAGVEKPIAEWRR